MCRKKVEKIEISKNLSGKELCIAQLIAAQQRPISYLTF